MYNAVDMERERQEAIQAGERALDSLYAAKTELNKARTWGVVDLFGGGLISGLIKHSKMSNAQQYLQDAKYNLQNFSRELRDVDLYYDTNLQVGDFLTFADFFFDGVLADWLVQDKINRARSQVDDAIYRVESILDRLAGMAARSY